VTNTGNGDIFIFPDMSGYGYGLYQLNDCLAAGSSQNCDPTKQAITRYIVSLLGTHTWWEDWLFVLANGPDDFAELSTTLSLQVTQADPQVTSTFKNGILGVELNGSQNPVVVSDGNRSMTINPRYITQFVPWTPYDEPVLNEGGVVNAASYKLGDLAPGSIYSAFGNWLAHQADSAVSTPLPTSLVRTQVVITSGGKDYFCPLYYDSRLQINFQVPFEVPLGPATIKTMLGSTSSNSVAVNIGTADPAIFQVGNNLGAVVHNSDYSLVTASNPARAGEYVDIFGTGFGPVTPSVPTGQAALNSPLSGTATSVTVKLGSQTLQPYWCGLAPDYVGLYQCTVQIPASVSGQVNLSLTIAATDSNSVILPIQ